jgi:hydrogenase small subunit
MNRADDMSAPEARSTPPPAAVAPEESVAARLTRVGVSRRDFFKLCGLLAGSLAVFGSPVGNRLASLAGDEAAVADALAATVWTPIIWHEFQGCTACTESMLRARTNSALDLLLGRVWLGYHETLMAAAGVQAEAARQHTMQAYAGRYLLVVDGAVPTKNGGQSCAIGGQSAVTLLKEAAAGAVAVIANGNCASFGGLPAAWPNPTGAVAVSKLLPGKKVVNVPGCPALPEVITGTLAYFLVNGAAPPLDSLKRPRAYYAETVHDECPREDNYEEERFARVFDDAGAKKGYCLYQLGCKGPITRSSCPTMKWKAGPSFPIASGHPCIGCTEPGFWDNYHIYQRGPGEDDDDGGGGGD